MTTDKKVAIMTKLVLNMNLIPPVPKEAKSILNDPQYDATKVFIALLAMYREDLMKISSDLYEIVLRIGLNLAYTYETNEKFRQDFNNKIIPLLISFTNKMKEIKKWDDHNVTKLF